MTVSLSPQTQELLQRKLKTGKYASADAVIIAALDALKQLSADPLTESALDGIDLAEDQIDHGEVHAWKGVREQVRAKFLGN